MNERSGDDLQIPRVKRGMTAIREIDIVCPHCGKEIELSVDPDDPTTCRVICSRCLHEIDALAHARRAASAG